MQEMVENSDIQQQAIGALCNLGACEREGEGERGRGRGRETHGQKVGGRERRGEGGERERGRELDRKH